MTPVQIHGKLRVEGANLVDAKGAPVQLYGMSTHGIGWFPAFVNPETFRTLRDDWKTNCVRLAMYTAEHGGYCTGGDRQWLRELVHSGVRYATELGMYVIIDWHILRDENPLVYANEAEDFFREMASAYASYENVIYEICNEPCGNTTWADVKAYAQRVIPVIRKASPDAVVLVGSPTWSQDIHLALQDPLDFENVMYTLHFYAATHKDALRQRLRDCVGQGLPVFVSEFGTCDASGNGALDREQTSAWRELMDSLNVSYLCWNLANQNESSSVVRYGCDKICAWTAEELSEQGNLIREWFSGK